MSMSQDKGAKEARAAKPKEATLLKLRAGEVKDIRPVRLMIHLQTGYGRLPVRVGALLLLGLMLYGSSAHGRRSV